MLKKFLGPLPSENPFLQGDYVFLKRIRRRAWIQWFFRLSLFLMIVLFISAFIFNGILAAAKLSMFLWGL